MNKQLEVLIIDDHTLFRDGLEGLLSRRGIKVVASVGNGSEGIEQALKLKPNVILLDLRMPIISGLSVLKILISKKVGVPIVILTISNEEEDLLDAMDAGARGYLLKDMDPDEFVSALHQVVAGETVMSSAMRRLYVIHTEDGGRTERKHPIDSLTPREREILDLLADGQSNKAIANRLGISDGTVKLHVKAVLRKLRVRSRVEAAVIAVEYSMRRTKRS